MAVLSLLAATDGLHRVSEGNLLLYAVLLVFLAVIFIPMSLAAVFASADGVRVRNLYSGRKIPWREIKGFRIGRYRLLGAVCIIDLTDGSTQHAWGIQVPNRLVGKRDSREMRMIDELNAELAAHDNARAQQKLAGR